MKRCSAWIFAAFLLLLPAAASAVQIITEYIPTYPLAVRLTWDGATLWVKEENAPILHRHDPETGQELGTARVGPFDFYNARAISSDGTHVWYCSGIEDMTFAEIDPAKGTVLRTIGLNSPTGTVAGTPAGMVWKNGELWVLMSAPTSICRVDPNSGQISHVMPLQLRTALGLAWDGTSFYVISGGRITRVDPQSGALLESFLAPGDRPTDLAWDGHYMWVASNRLFKLDLRGEPYELMRQTKSIGWGDIDYYRDIDWQGGALWLSGTDIRLINAGTNNRTLPSPYPSGNTGIASDGSHVLVANRFFSPKLNWLDFFTGSVSASFDYDGYDPEGMTIQGQHLWIADMLDTALYVYSWPGGAFERKVRAPGPEAAGVTWDGEALWECDRVTGLLSQVDTTNGEVLAQFRIPASFPMGIAADGLDGTMWAIAYGDHQTLKLAFPPGPTHILDWRGAVAQSGIALSWRLTSGSTPRTITVERRAAPDTSYTPLGQASCQNGACEYIDSAPVAGTICYYRLRIEEADASRKYLGPLSIASQLPRSGAISPRLQLTAGAFPNPVVGGATFRAFGASGQILKARILDVRGRLVRTIDMVEREPGEFQGDWDGAEATGRHVSPGIYFAEIQGTGGERATARVTVLR